MEKKVIAAAVCILLLLLGFFIGGRVEHKKFPDIEERTDTLFLWDTVEIDKPAPVEVI